MPSIGCGTIHIIHNSWQLIKSANAFQPCFVDCYCFVWFTTLCILSIPAFFVVSWSGTTETRNGVRKFRMNFGLEMITDKSRFRTPTLTKFAWKIRVSLDLFNRPGIICGTMCIARRGCPSAATVISWYFIVFILAWAFCVYACAKWAKLRTNNRQITIGICVYFIVQVVGPSCDLSSPLTIKGHTHTQPYKHRVELAQFS